MARRTTETPAVAAADGAPLNALDALAVVGAAILALFVARMPILTPDVWWHLATGRLILAEGIPDTDPFSWALAGADWFLHEWLADVLLMQVYDASGLLGLVTVRAVMIAAALVAAYRLTRLHAGSLLSMVLLAPAAWATQRNWLDRPQLWTFLLLPLLVWLLERARLHRVDRRTWVLLPLLMLAWANLHGGFMIGVAVTGLWAVLTVAQSADRAADARRWGLLLGLGVVATCATPNGLEGLLYPLRYVGSGLSESLIEERVGTLNSNYARVHLAFVAALLVLFAVRARRLPWTHLGLGLLLAALSMPRLAGVELPFAAERHAPLFLLIGVPLLIWNLQVFLPQPAWRPAWRSRGALGGALVVAVAALVVVATQWPRDGSPQARLLPGRYPVAATEWMQRSTLPQNLLNPYRWGGWLLFHLWPQHLVSIDSRGDLHGIEAIRESEFLHAVPPGGGPRVQQILDRDAIDLVVWQLLTLDFGPLQLTPLADYLLQSPEWRLVFWDREDPRFKNHPFGTTGVFLREHPRNQALLQLNPPARVPRFPGPRRDFGFPPRR